MKPLYRSLVFIICLLFLAVNAAADFDARHWAKYAEINLPHEGALPPFGRLVLSSTAEGPGRNPADIRVVTRSKREVPYQLVTRKAETRTKEIQAKIVNLSMTNEKDTQFEAVLPEGKDTYNAIEIVTDTPKFFRQVQIFGGTDGVNWYRIRSDAVIFDYSDSKPMRHTRISIPDSRYRHLKVIVKNRLEAPIKIAGMKIYQDTRELAVDEYVAAEIKKQEPDAAAKTSLLEIELKNQTDIHELVLYSSDKNYYRNVEIFVKRGESWVRHASDFIFNFEGEGMMEAKTRLSFPEVNAQQMKLVISNMDSPALKITSVNAMAYQRNLVFKIDGRDNYFVFWGNSAAKTPSYDIASHVARQELNSIQIFGLEQMQANPDFTGSDSALPFTERYKWLLYVVVGLVIAGLGWYQFRVIKRTGEG